MSQQIILKVREEYYDLVPRSTKEERRALKEDIMSNGQQDPVVINRDGFILDGHTRYEICQELGLEIKYRVQEFSSKEEERRYVINCNVNRRHLNSFQRIELMYEIFKMEKKDALKRRGRHNEPYEKEGSAGEIVGRNIGLNRRAVEQGVYLMENASQRTIEKLRRKEIGIERAYNELKKPAHYRVKVKRYIKNGTKLICPHCQQISKKSEWKIA